MVCLVWTCGVHAQQDYRESASSLASLDRYSLPSISPSGEHVAVLENSNEGAAVVIYALSDEAELTKIAQTAIQTKVGSALRYDAYQGLIWLSDTKLLLDISEPLLNRYDGEIVRSWYFKVVDLETMELADLLPLELTKNYDVSEYGPIEILNTPSPLNPDLIVSVYTAGGEQLRWYPKVFAFNKTTLEPRRLQKSKRRVLGWMSDLAGQVRIGFEYNSDGYKGTIYRRHGETKWRTLKAAKPKPGVTFSPLSFSKDPNLVYVVSNHEGDPGGLYLYDLRTLKFTQKIAQHDRQDVSSIRLSSEGELLQVSAGDEIISLAEEERAYLLALQKKLEFDYISLVDQTRPDRLRIYATGASDSKDSYYLFDTTTGAVTKIFDSAGVQADNPDFGHTWELSLEARDGLKLDAFLALPAGEDIDTSQNLPFVLMPHGGPWARDFAVFDPLTQYVNSLGIGVLKVNFRGSEGYGAEFAELGVGEWGQAMQHDLTDALQWGIKRGWVDPDQVCIVGWSYGGYASLMASIEQAEHFKCAASIAGVSDLVALVRYTTNEETLRRIGVRSSFDGSRVRGISPRHRADEVEVPIFLAHGTGDEIVSVHKHYAPMLAALKERGKVVDYVALLHGDHSLSAPNDRQILYERLGDFLLRYLRVEAAVEPLSDKAN